MKLFSFSSRIGRLRFLIVQIVTYVFGGGLLTPIMSDDNSIDVGVGVAGLVVAVVLLWISLAADFNRLHDAGKSGWWVLFYFVPIANIILFLYLLFASGERRQNRWGPPL